MLKAFIQIVEKAPHGGVHRIDFSSEECAWEALDAGQKFWAENNYNAFMIRNDKKAVAVSSDVVASVTVVIIKNAKKKKKK